VHRVNQAQRDEFIKKIDAHFGDGGSADLAGKRIAVWGIAFKPGTDDVREAPSITIIRHLIERGATVAVHDPVAHETCRRELGDQVTYVDNTFDVLDRADALVICTDWDEFRHPDFDEMRQRMHSPVVFDGRNLYRHRTMREYGFVYHCVGREPVVADGVEQTS
jgi:UDPglucose 6-dehydrogenase